MNLYFPRSYLQTLWPWTKSVEHILRYTQPRPFTGSHLALGSDYSGDHKGSGYRTYCYLIMDTDTSSDWPRLRSQVRRHFLPNGRRMSFKNLGDGHRQRALVPFLQSANTINGHLVALVVTKKLSNLSWRGLFDETTPKRLGLRGVWKERSFEAMFRSAQMFALMLSIWSRPWVDVTWITDQDEIVANDNRLDDAQQLAARLSAQFVPHHMGVFAMNSTVIDGDDRAFEDFVAVADLAAGMLSEIASSFVSRPGAPEYSISPTINLSHKTEIISDWFWWPHANLKRTCILIDAADSHQFKVTRITMKYV
jgi:hypothetical protein